MKKTVLVMLGPPGSGKGTQAELISQKYQLYHIIVGDIVRSVSKERTSFGGEVKNRFEKGIPQPDDIINRIIKDEISKKIRANKPGFILDPYPISIVQAKGLERLIKKFGLDNPIVINIKVSEKSVLKRLLLRGKEQKRADDRPDVIKRRYREYQKRISDLHKFYKNKKVCWVDIDGEPNIQTVNKEIISKLDKIFRKNGAPAQEDIKILREGGRRLAKILDKLCQAAKVGVSTLQLNNLAEKLIKNEGGTPNFKNFNGYPFATCISINDELVHGLPSPRKIKEGDLVGIDVGMEYQGWHLDTAVTLGIGKISSEDEKLLKATKRSLEEGISKVKPGANLGEVSNAIQNSIESAGFSVIRQLSGHGIGRTLHQDPRIYNFGSKNSGPVIKEGMLLAIEPMVSAGDWKVKVGKDGFTVKTIDGSRSAHFEHTVLVTEKGSQILTQE